MQMTLLLSSIRPARRPSRSSYEAAHCMRELRISFQTILELEAVGKVLRTDSGLVVSADVYVLRHFADERSNKGALGLLRFLLRSKSIACLVASLATTL